MQLRLYWLDLKNLSMKTESHFFISPMVYSRRHPSGRSGQVPLVLLRHADQARKATFTGENPNRHV
jgi:hypothetical protein